MSLIGNKSVRSVRDAEGKIRDFYCAPRVDSDSGKVMSLYEIWERQRGFNDSVTPSTYCSEYRQHVVGLITARLPVRGSVFSIGCGNAFVERDLVASGYRVDAIDCNEDAVRLAATKGVGATVGNFLEMRRGSLKSYDVIYADGLIGHLVDRDVGADRFMEQLRRTAPRKGAWLIVSNDAPLASGKAIEPHAEVEDFWFVSKAYLAGLLAGGGCDVVECDYFRYMRPISGERDRTICVAQVAR